MVLIEQIQCDKCRKIEKFNTIKVMTLWHILVLMDSEKKYHLCKTCTRKLLKYLNMRVRR